MRMEGWIARSESGNLWFFSHEPFRYQREQVSTWMDGTGYHLELDRSQFPEVTFSNSPERATLEISAPHVAPANNYSIEFP